VPGDRTATGRLPALPGFALGGCSAGLAAHHVGGASKILPVTFLVIVATVALYGLTAVPLQSWRRHHPPSRPAVGSFGHRPVVPDQPRRHPDPRNNLPPPDPHPGGTIVLLGPGGNGTPQ
jgi:hypothetical protein